MHFVRYPHNSFSLFSNHNTLITTLSELNQEFNKDSVNTSYGQVQTVQNKDFQTHPKIQENIQRKTKIIWKQQKNKVTPILKQKKVLQTLRDITRNIKNQLNGSKRKTQAQNQQKKLKLQKSQKNNKSPEANRVELKAQTIEDERQNLETNKKQLQGKCPNINQKYCSTQKRASTEKMQQIFLYSKYKGITQSFPLYEDHKLTEKKEFREMTIHREADNDIESDEEQIQMSVGYMYYELMNSCHKRSELKKQELKKQELKMKSSNIEKYRKNDNATGMDDVRQKLTFY